MGCWACFSGEAHLGLLGVEASAARIDSYATVVRVSGGIRRGCVCVVAGVGAFDSECREIRCVVFV